MSKLFNTLFLIVSRFAYPVVTGFVVLVAAALFSQGGFSLVELLILAGLVGAFVVIWWRFHARQSVNVPDNAPDLLTSIRGSGKYAMLAFESEFCISSMTVGQRLAALEAAYPETFHVYSLSIFKTPGKELFEDYKGKSTPTFVLVDPDGKMVMNWPLVLPIEHVNFEITRRQAAAAQSR